MTDDIKVLLKKAETATENAYAPYSGYKVGAALLTATGEIFTGCNVENASYGLTVCAERIAVFNAVSEGFRNFKAIAIFADGEKLPSPCGACRQVLSEFSDNLTVVFANRKTMKETDLKTLLPDTFKI
ncbi:MAG: cytidine deaminase [Candidatus Cloacimonetes bacterium]|nr:cytidine deaminase [Candidatus Cloacimonadota bacterium]